MARPPRLAPALLAALALLALGGCAPNATPITKRGYQGKPPLGTPITFAPADELDVDGDGAGDGWWWIPFDGATGPEEVATCGDGSTTGLAVSPGPGDGLVVFFDGGGACWSYETCAAGAAVDRRFGVEAFKAEARAFVPCSLTARANLPPSLAGATIVFVPYCTGDVHGGDAVQEYGNALFNVTWHHRGHANVLAYLRRLGATFPAVDALLVAGSSAGGFGALVNYPAFRWYWPDARGHLVDDSGPALVANDVPANFRDAWFNSWHLGVATDPFCLDCRRDLSAAFSELADQHRQDRLAFVSHARDQVMQAFMLFPLAAGYEAALVRLDQEVLAPTPNVRAFIDDGSDHMLLTPVDACGAGSYLASHVVGAENPLGLDAWLEQLVSGDPAWATRRE
jgi:pectinacetylesterase